MDWLLAMGAAAGLGVAAGVRAFVPLAVISALGLAELAVTLDGSDASWAASGGFLLGAAVLAAGEIVLEKAPRPPVPAVAVDAVRVAAGGLLGWIAAADQEVNALVGVVVGAAAAVLGTRLREGLRPAKVEPGVRRTLSAGEDLVSAVVGALCAVAGLVGYVVAAFAGFVVARVRRRRGETYAGLRVLRK